MFSLMKLSARVTDSALQGTELCELLLNFMDMWLAPEITPCSRIVLHNQNFRFLGPVPIKETLKCNPSHSVTSVYLYGKNILRSREHLIYL